MDSENKLNVDKNSFAFLFNEDIYLVPQEAVLAKPQITEENPVVHESKPKIEKPLEAEKKTPVIPKSEIKATTQKDFAIILLSQQDLDSNKELLSKILGAIKLDLNKVDLHISASSADSVFNNSNYKYIISFGLEATKYKGALNKVSKNGSSSILFSNNLNELDKDIEKKKALWAALKSFL